MRQIEESLPGDSLERNARQNTDDSIAGAALTVGILHGCQRLAEVRRIQPVNCRRDRGAVRSTIDHTLRPDAATLPIADVDGSLAEARYLDETARRVSHHCVDMPNAGEIDEMS